MVVRHILRRRQTPPSEQDRTRPAPRRSQPLGCRGGRSAHRRADQRHRVRLRKYVTTEQVQQTVPVQRERVRVERAPITDANLDAATSGPELSEAEHEVILREEEPVIEKRVVPRERVRLDKDTVTDQEQVAEPVRKEQINVDHEDTRGGRHERRRRR